MPVYGIVVTHADGQSESLPVTDSSLEAIGRQAIRFARNASMQRPFVGEALTPKWVEITDEAGDVVLQIAVDAI